MLTGAADLAAALAANGLGAAHAFVAAKARPCLHMIHDGGAIGVPLGSTRFGGVPDLAEDATWPRGEDGAPLRFLGQLNLADLASRTGPTALPAAGLLSLFGENSDEGAEAAALLTPPSAALAPRHPPAAPLNPVAVRFTPGLSLPLDDLDFLQEIETITGVQRIDGFLETAAATPEGAIGQILGWAFSAADDLHADIAFAALGRPGQARLAQWRTEDDWERAKTMESRLAGGHIYRPWGSDDDDNVRWIQHNRALIAAETARWTLLLRLDSNKPMNLWMNDADPIYLFIGADDLARGDFSRVRAIVTQS